MSNTEPGQVPATKTIGQLRRELHWSKETLASRAGVSYNFVHKAELGKPITRAYALLLCEALNVKLENVSGLNIIQD